MSDDKTEAPTDHKLREARKKGQMAKSRDLATAVVMIAVVITLKMMEGAVDERLRRIVKLALDFGPGRDLPILEVYRRMGSIAIEALLVVVPLLLVAALAAVIGVAMQVGLEITPDVVSPKPESIDPMAGLKRMVSVKSMLQLVQMIVKAIILGTILWTLIKGLMPMLAGTAYHTVGTIGTVSWAAIHRVLLISAVLFLVMGVVDYAIQRWQFMKSQRMSMDEVKREHKGQEGDPEIKGKRKQIAREDAQSPPKRKAVSGASAVVVNPTHFAAAIRYQPEECGLPIVVAKGVDDEALDIRRIAEDLGVPVLSNPPLARSLYRVPLGQPVPEELFESVAAVLRWVNKIGKANA
jgi:type III secretion protein U